MVALLGHLPAGVRRETQPAVRHARHHARRPDSCVRIRRRSRRPNLDRLAREGVLFEQAVSPAPLTLPAHSSIFTGTFPPAHGVRDNGGFFLDEQRDDAGRAAAGARASAPAGSSAPTCSITSGASRRAFRPTSTISTSKYQSLSLGSVDRPGNEVADKALAWLDTVGSKRFFGWVHFYDAHSPYDPPEPFKSRYAGHPYIGEIAFVDSQVGRLLAYLDAHHLADNTIVVVMGDHGESLGRARRGHARLLRLSVDDARAAADSRAVRRDGRAARGRHGAQHRHPADRARTARREDRRTTSKGSSVVPLMTGAKKELGLAAYSEAIYPRFHFGWSDLRALTVGPLQVRRRAAAGALRPAAGSRRAAQPLRRAPGARRSHEPGAGRARTADVGVRGGAEGGGRSRSRRARAAGRARLRRHVRHRGWRRIAPGLADPKDKIQLFNLMTQARETARHDKESDEGLHALERVVAQDPKVIDAWFMLGNEYYRRRQFAHAIEQFKRALELEAGLRPRRHQHGERLPRARPRSGGDGRLPAVHGARSEERADPVRGGADPDRQRQARRSAARTDRRRSALEPKLAAARNALGVLALRRGDLGAAEREIRAAIDEKPDVRLAHYNLALLAEAAGGRGARRSPNIRKRSSCTPTATRRPSISASCTSAPAIGSGRSTRSHSDRR